MSTTLENLTKAFIGESQARNRYTSYAKIAKKEGYEQVAAVFEETANQETEHAKWLFRLISQLKQNDDDIVVEAGAPTILKDTASNLRAAIAGENFETTEMYPGFANTAEDEGHEGIAKRLRAIATAEAHHRDRYMKLLKEVEAATVFKKAEKTYWVCRKCGYIHEAEAAPETCPSCGHPQAYFQVQSEVY